MKNALQKDTKKTDRRASDALRNRSLEKAFEMCPTISDFMMFNFIHPISLLDTIKKHVEPEEKEQVQWMIDRLMEMLYRRSEKLERSKESCRLPEARSGRPRDSETA